MSLVFVHDFAYVDAPLHVVVGALLGASSLERQAAAAVDEAERFLAVVGPLGAAPGLSKTVMVAIGEPHERGDGFVVPLLWTATGAHALFPALEADLELASAGPRRTQISLMGTYAPPGGELGRLVDRFVLHRVAEATVRRFLAELAGSLAPHPALVRPKPRTA